MFQKDLIYERKDGIPGGSSRESDGPGQTQGSARGLFPARPALSHELPAPLHKLCLLLTQARDGGDPKGSVWAVLTENLHSLNTLRVGCASNFILCMGVWGEGEWGVCAHACVCMCVLN